MQGGDLGTFETHRVVIVLEGVLVDLPSPTTTGRGRKKVTAMPPAENWGWHKQAVKYLNNTARMQSIPIDVVTFISEEVATAAAEWFERYYVEVSSCDYRDYGQFCEALQWAPEVERVIDSEPLRLRNYGQRGYQTVRGGAF